MGKAVGGDMWRSLAKMRSAANVKVVDRNEKEGTTGRKSATKERKPKVLRAQDIFSLPHPHYPTNTLFTGMWISLMKLIVNIGGSHCPIVLKQLQPPVTVKDTSGQLTTAK